MAPQNCLPNFRRAEVDGTQRMRATLDGLGEIIVLTPSTDMFAKRIEWVTGYPVSALAPAVVEAPKPVAETALVRESREGGFQARAELRALAAQTPPAHNCHLRREILKARAELAALSRAAA